MEYSQPVDGLELFSAVQKRPRIDSTSRCPASRSAWRRFDLKLPCHATDAFPALTNAAYAERCSDLPQASRINTQYARIWRQGRQA